MSLFHHHPHLHQPDPLGDGVGDDIAHERAEPEHFELQDQLDGELAERWERTVAELGTTEQHKDDGER